LVGAGIDPVVIVSAVDESAALRDLLTRDPDAGPEAQVLALAQVKARDVAGTVAGCPGEGDRGEWTGKVRDAIVLGCDSMLELDGEVLGKPRDARDAAARIAQQSGREATLHTGHWLVDLAGGAQVGGVSRTIVRFSELSAEDIAAYVATGEPLGVAGAFTIDGLGGPFIEGVIGDHHGVVGLSLPTLRHLLADLGIAIWELWRRPAR
jgi:septum formation protein